MPLVKNIPLIHAPQNLTEALVLLQSYPRADILSGATHQLPQSRVVVSLHQIEDLKRIHLGEKFLDMGAGVTFQQALALPQPQFHQVFQKPLRKLGPLGLRNLATLGGNICQGGELGDLFPLLMAVGAQLDFRTLRGSHWHPASVLMEGDSPLQSGEVLTRIRIPLENWSEMVYEKVGLYGIPEEERLSLTALFQYQGEVLTLTRILFYLPPRGILRAKTLESFLAGQNLPVGPRERVKALEYLEKDIEESTASPSVFQTLRIKELVKGMLRSLEAKDLNTPEPKSF